MKSKKITKTKDGRLIIWSAIIASKPFIRKILTVVLIFIFFACSSSKSKAKAEEKVKEQSKTVLNEETKKSIEEFQDQKTESEKTTLADFIEVEVRQGESLIIETTDKDGNKTSTIFTGSGKVTKGQEVTSQKTITNEQKYSNEEATTEKKEVAEKEATTDKKNKSIEVERSGLSWWLWVLIILFVLLVIAKNKFNILKGFKLWQ